MQVRASTNSVPHVLFLQPTMCLISPTFLPLRRFRCFLFSPTFFFIFFYFIYLFFLLVSGSANGHVSDPADGRGSLAQRRLTPKHWHSLPVFTRVCRRAHNAAGAVCKVHRRVVPTAGGQKAARLSLRVYTAYEKVFEQGILECQLPQPFYFPARRLRCG